MDQPAKTGICLTCGFLCRRDTQNLHMSWYFELTRDDRVADRWFGVHPSPEPWCFRFVPILQEIREASGVTVPATDPPELRDAERQRQRQAAIEVVRKERDCPLWMPHQPGLGPIEHFGGLAMQEQEQRRVAFQRQMEQERREFQEALERQRQAFDSQMETSRQAFTVMLAEANDRFQKTAAKVGWALAVVAIVLAATSLTCESLLWTWLPWLRWAALGCAP